MNCESWCLTKTDILNLEKAEIWALKRILNLPKTTPSVAIRYTTGTFYTKIRIGIKQLLYLQRVLNRDEEHHTKKLLKEMEKLNCGWSKQICNTLQDYDLTQDWNEITTKTIPMWKKEVLKAAGAMQIKLMKEECCKNSNGERTTKQKNKNNL